MSLTLAFVMDPLEGVQCATDTSYALMQEAARRGHRVLHVAPSALQLEQDQVILRAHRVLLRPQSETPPRPGEAVRVPARDCAAIFIRTDPPFDEAYLLATWMLTLAEQQGVRVINSPQGLREANEKLYALQWPTWCPTTLVSSSRAEILRFLKELTADAIAKPVDGHGGSGVLRLRSGDSNVPGIIDLLTREGLRPIIVQAFIENDGDRRLFLLDGKIRAALRRMPPPGDHRGNVHVGGQTEACPVSDADRALEAAVGGRLRRDGLFFVGIDMIGSHLVEVNVTSPTLVQELKRLGGPDLAAEIIDAVER